MKKEVLVSISGLQIDAFADNLEDEMRIEVITPADYYLKNGKHYILYDEVTEGISEITKNRIKIIDDRKVEIGKSGAVNSQMVFEKDKHNVTHYETPFGQILVGVYTREMYVDTLEDRINVKINYELEVNHEVLADCVVRINIQSKNAGGFAIRDYMEF